MAPPKEHHPQAVMSHFWKRFHRKVPGKVTSIFPRELYKSLDPEFIPDSAGVRNVAQSYEDARAKCVAMVKEIVDHCERTNSSFCDKDFDLESDYFLGIDNCLRGLVRSSEDQARPGAVHRVPWIYENPLFTVDGYSGSDIKQGHLGDCWWLAGVGTVAHRKDLMNKICVARDEECGVYGFVFFRDGEWIPTVIDDNLYLRVRDYGKVDQGYDASGKKSKDWRKRNQTGSDALYGASCQDENEIWLPLLEKAYAKAHGDYEAIEGGWVGAAVEDLTGGVTSMLLANRVLRKEKLWHELRQVDQENGDFVYGLSASGSSDSNEQNGLVLGHAYCIVKAVEVEDGDGRKVKLLQIRNPWGRSANSGMGEWHGPWSDGSKEWTPEMIKKLRHEFGDDGVFWMTLEDTLENFHWLHRTRLFDERWTIAQQWTSVPISWIPGYLTTRFVIKVEKPGVAVIVLSKLDERYFKSLEGEYRFFMEFFVRASGSDEKIAEATYDRVDSENRSISCEVYLEPGSYTVIPKVIAQRCLWKKALKEVVRSHALVYPLKLQQKGMLYDLAHAKVGVIDEDEENERKRQEDRKKKREQKKKEAEENDIRLAMLRMRAAMIEMQEELNKREKQKDEVEHKEKSEGNQNQKKGKKSGARNQPESGAASKPSAYAKEEDENEEQDEAQEEENEEEEETDDDDSDDDYDDDSDDEDIDISKDDKLLWNPVCVMGLRVYSEDEEIEVRVVDGDEEEEGEEEEEEEEQAEEGADEEAEEGEEEEN